MTPEIFNSLVDPRFNLMRESGEVIRWHTRPCLKPQNDATHQWNVARILIQLLGFRISRSLLIAAIIHDMGEVGCGDLPRPVKKHLGLTKPLAAAELAFTGLMFKSAGANLHPEMIELSQIDAMLLSTVDLIEALEYSTAEIMLGNQRMVSALEKNVSSLITGIATILFTFPDEGQLVEDMCSYVERYVYGPVTGMKAGEFHAKILKAVEATHDARLQGDSPEQDQASG